MYITVYCKYTCIPKNAMTLCNTNQVIHNGKVTKMKGVICITASKRKALKRGLNAGIKLEKMTEQPQRVKIQGSCHERKTKQCA